MHDKKHMWLMALACIIPLVIIIMLPLFGIKGNVTWIALIIMFALHIVVMGVMTKEDNHEKSEQSKPARKSLH